MKARKKQMQIEWSMRKGPRHHLLVPSQYMGGGPWVKVFRGCGLEVRRKGVYSGVPAQVSLGKCPIRMTFHPKEVCVGRDHLMHAIEVGDEVT